ncbi:MAG: ATP-binding protein [Propionibacteriaceae bacterium]|jgi:hypothetical protein|nr:ATP-binding protein [Propionibacteriaceae bacterium]
MGKQRRADTQGRSVDRLLADFGHELPKVTPPPPETKEPRLFAPQKNVLRPYCGWQPGKVPPEVYQMTSDQAAIFWPFISAPGLKPHGAQMGVDYFSGGAFYCDPNGWVMDDDMPVSNPNVMVLGKPGMGKSATVKAFIIRMAAFGYRCLVVGDPKDEYEKLCRFFQVEPIAIGQGLANRINPLDFGPLGQGWEQLSVAEQKRRCDIVFARWLTLIRGMVGSQGVPFGPTEAKVVDSALKQVTGFAQGASSLRVTTIPELWQCLNSPPQQMIEECRYSSSQHFWDDTRALRDALAEMFQGALAGLFDGPTTIDLDWMAPIASLSLSRLEGLGDEATGMALLCLNSWARAMRELSEPGDMRVVVRDECWRQFRLGIDAVKSFDADLRLSRRDGDIQMAIAHKPSDFLSVGDAGSQAVQIAKDMFHLADTKILLGQDQEVANQLGELLGINPMAQQLVTGWCRQEKGRALWIAGERYFKVKTILHPVEEQLTWTQDALEAAA